MKTFTIVTTDDLQNMCEYIAANRLIKDNTVIGENNTHKITCNFVFDDEQDLKYYLCSIVDKENNSRSEEHFSNKTKLFNWLQKTIWVS